METCAVILVHTTSHAIQVERLLKRAGLEVKLVPTPRHFSSDCGSAVRVNPADLTPARKILRDAGVSIDRIELIRG